MTVSNTRRQTGNTALTREVNRSLILNYIKTSGPTSVTALANGLGLHRTTVYSQVREMVTDGVLAFGPTVRPWTGRPATLVTLNTRGRSIIGAQLSIKYVQAVVSDLEGTIRERRLREIDPESGFAAIYQVVVETIDEMVAIANRLECPPLGVGIAVPGLVNETEGRLLLTANLGWHDVDLGAMLEQRFGMPIWVRNGAHASLLGERYFGAGRDLHDWIYLSVGVEIAAGLFLRDNVYFGTNGYAGEIGHTIIAPDGPSCSCGNHGCWEALASERALLRYYREAGGDDTVPLLELFQRAEAGDNAAELAIDRVAHYLSLGIVNVVHTFNPERIVLGGQFFLAGERLVAKITERLGAFRVFSAVPPQDLLRLSELGLDVAVLGAVSVVLHNVLDGPRVV